MSFSQFVSAVQNAIRREDGAASQSCHFLLTTPAVPHSAIHDIHVSLSAGAQLRGLLQINNPDASSAVFEVIDGSVVAPDPSHDVK